MSFEMKWNKCVDKLPKDNQECLVAFHIIPGDAGCGHAFHMATYFKGEFLTWELSRNINYVTHWMKLPKGPDEV